MRGGLWFAVVVACGSPSTSKQPTQQVAPSAAAVRPEPAPAAAACAPEFEPYDARPASSVEVHLPAVPRVAKKPIKVGDAYTVWGASYFLRSQVHRAEVRDKAITIEGYIVKTNLPEAPRCAVHPAGKADPEGCRAPVPAFWIGDAPGDAVSSSIKVMGWASNYAQIYDAIREFDSRGKDAEYIDSFWGVRIPNPLPAAGAKVRVMGTYGSLSRAASSGAEADPYMGLLTIDEIVYLVHASAPATLPGMSRAPR